MIKIENISKTFKDNCVLKNISIEIKDGEVYGLIGANGAGKTTLFNIISQMLSCDAGSIFVDGKKITSIDNLCGNIGIMQDIPAMYDFMTAYEYFEFIASPMNKTAAQVKEISLNLLQTVGLKEVLNKRIKTFSRGMKQRMGIAAALISAPKIIIMDEPSSALDPHGRFEVIEIIKSLKAAGKTVILSTHILNDVEKVCDRVGLLVNGNIVVEGTIADILKSYSENAFVVDFENEKSALDFFEKFKFDNFEVLRTGPISVIVKFSDEKKAEVLKHISNFSNINNINLKTATLEEIFLKASKADEGGNK